MSLIDDIDALHAKATPGQRRTPGRYVSGSVRVFNDCPGADFCDAEFCSADDAELYVALRNAYPAISRVLLLADEWSETPDSQRKTQALYAAVRALREVRP